MTTKASYEERGSDWSHQVSATGTIRWLQRDQILPLSAKGVACETSLPPPFLHTASNQKLDSGKAWEQGYMYFPLMLDTATTHHKYLKGYITAYKNFHPT